MLQESSERLNTLLKHESVTFFREEFEDFKLIFSNKKIK